MHTGTEVGHGHHVLGHTDVRDLPQGSRMTDRVRVDGNHLELGGEPFRVRGVAYGRPERGDGCAFPDSAQVKQDLVSISEAGFNTIRTYDVPPPEVLDAARALDLRLIVGTRYDDWRHHQRTGRTTDRLVLDAGRRAIAEVVARCAEEPLVMAISVGRGLPADVVRVQGVSRVEQVLGALVEQVHRSAPGVLATHSNRPATDFLHAPGQDLVCFDVLDEDPQVLRRFLEATQRRAGDRPVVLTELGLASGWLGFDRQAQLLREQLRVIDEVGLAGATLVAWTDDSDLGGARQDDWGFGLTTVNRHPKPALAVASEWTRRRMEDLLPAWPTVSVVVTTRDDARRIRGCLEALLRCDYPGLDVIVCDRGSTDDTASIARAFPVRVIDCDGLVTAAARNAGIAAASGDLVAMLDAGAVCHRQWPFHVAMAMVRGREHGVAAAGGPALPFPAALLEEHAVAAAPGSPRAVLSHDGTVQQLSGWNLAVRADALHVVGGLDPTLSCGGEDVDLCWRLIEAGYHLAFTPAAQVIHHRPHAVGDFVAQQRGCGAAERALWVRHARRFGAGRRGAAGPGAIPRWLRPVLHHQGLRGMPRSESLREHRRTVALAVMRQGVPLLPGLALAGVFLAWMSAWWLLLTGAALVGLLGTAGLAAVHARPPADVGDRTRFRALVGLLHVIQPLARTSGRLQADPARRGTEAPPAWLGRRAGLAQQMSAVLRSRGCMARYGTDPEAGDLIVRVGPLLSAGVVTAVTGDGRPPRVRVAYRGRWAPIGVVVAGVAWLLALGMGQAAGVLGVLAALVGLFERAALQRHIGIAAQWSAADVAVGGITHGDLVDPQDAGVRIGRHARIDTDPSIFRAAHGPGHQGR